MKSKHFLRLFILGSVIASTFSARATINILNYWHMGEADPGAVSGGAATTLMDSATFPENLSVQGPATYTNDVDATATARTGSSLSTVFTNGAFAAGPSVAPLTDDFGIECWVKPGADVNAGQIIVYNGSTSTSGWGFLVSNGQFQALYGGVEVFGAGVATPNVWAHVALVRDSTHATLYVNGLPAGTSDNFPRSPDTAFAIAAPPQVAFGGGQSLTGRVDEVRVFDFNPGKFSTNDLLYFQTNYVFGTTNYVVGPGAGTDSVVLKVQPGRSWAATVSVPWLSLSASSGTDSTNIIFDYAPNPGPTRTGTISVGAQMVTITQAGSTYVAAGPLTTLVDASAGLNFPNCNGLDAVGNFYFTDGTGTGFVHKWTKASNTSATIITSGLQFPFGMAVDNPGNVFLINGGGNFIQKCSATDSNITMLVSSGLNGPTRGATDTAGNLYFSDTDNDAIKEWIAANGSVSNVVSSGLAQPSDLAVDAAGNVCFFDEGNHAIKKWAAANNTTTILVNNVTNVAGIAIDNGGNVYFADKANNAIKRWQAVGGSVFTMINSGINSPRGFHIDDARNMYIVENTFNGRVLEQPRAFVNTATRVENSAAGTDALTVVLPASANLLPPFAPTSSDTFWLNITGVANGVVTISFTANTGATRTANITVLGQSVPITQQTTVTPPVIFGYKLLTNTVAQFSFSNNQSTFFSIITSTNVSTPLSNWSVLSAASNMGSGLFQFTTLPVTNDIHRFYRIRSP